MCFYGVKSLTCNLLMEVEEDSNLVGYLPSATVGSDEDSDMERYLYPLKNTPIKLLKD